MGPGDMRYLTSRLNINTAAEQDLASVPLIGQERAHSIVEYRQSHGPFDTIDDLKKVPGVTDQLVSDLRQALAVEGRRT